MASNTTEWSATDNTKTHTAPHSDATHVEQAPAQHELANSNGLRNSPLSRLPSELRNVIFEMVFTHLSNSYHCTSYSMSAFFSSLGTRAEKSTCPDISRALNIMAICKQIRSETKSLLLLLNYIRIQRGDIHGCLSQLERALPLLKNPAESWFELGTTCSAHRMYCVSV